MFNSVFSVLVDQLSWVHCSRLAANDYLVFIIYIDALQMILPSDFRDEELLDVFNLEYEG